MTPYMDLMHKGAVDRLMWVDLSEFQSQGLDRSPRRIGVGCAMVPIGAHPGFVGDSTNWMKTAHDRTWHSFRAVSF